MSLNMMPSVLGANIPHMTPHAYPSDPMFDEFSRQLALSDSIRRISRGSNGQRTPGAMRVVKPSSASNSPQAMMARRRTMMNDNCLSRRRQQALDQAVFQQMQDSSAYTNYQDLDKRSNRPVSWHPSSRMQQQPQQIQMQMPQPDLSHYVIPTPMPYHQTDVYSGYHHLPPTPAAYSGHASPTCNFSPLSLPFAASSQPQAGPTYVSPDTWDSAPQYTPSMYATDGSPGATEPFPAYSAPAPCSWNTFAGNEFDACTAPPTPDEYHPLQQHSQPVVAPEESIPYQPLEEEAEEEEEEEGEILVGMGLYDTPNKSDTDPGLENYRTTTSQLLGTTYRKGKGWKLEEAWEPPTTDDEDGEEDANGEEQEENNQVTESPTAQQSWI